MDNNLAKIAVIGKCQELLDKIKLKELEKDTIEHDVLKTIAAKDCHLVSRYRTVKKYDICNDIDIVICFYGTSKKRFNATQRALKYMLKSNPQPRRFIFIEAQRKEADAKFKAMLSSLKNVEYRFIAIPKASEGIELKMPLWNIGAQMSKAAKICFIDSDIVFCRQNWLSSASKKLDQYDVISLSGFQYYEKSRNALKLTESIGHAFMTRKPDGRRIIGHIGFTVGMTRDFYDNVYGQFDAVSSNDDAWMWTKIIGKDRINTASMNIPYKFSSLDGLDCKIGSTEEVCCHLDHGKPNIAEKQNRASMSYQKNDMPFWDVIYDKNSPDVLPVKNGNAVQKPHSKDTIVYCVDGDYAANLMLINSLRSLLPNTSNDINILTVKSNKYIENLKNVSSRVNVIRIDQLIDRYFKDINIQNTNPWHVLNESAYYRLLMFKTPEIVDSYERAIYLDCDTVVHVDLDKSLFALKSSSRLLAVAEDNISRNPKLDLVNQLREFGIEFDDEDGKLARYDYFNSGVLLFNLKKLDADVVFNECLSLVHFNFLFHDQDILNYVFRDFEAIDCKYNDSVCTDREYANRRSYAIDHLCADSIYRIRAQKTGKFFIDNKYFPMIPKIMHFIYIGEHLPEYVINSIKAFKKLNPSFKINFIYEKTLKNLQNKDSIECMKLIQSKVQNKYRLCWENPKNLINTIKSFTIDKIRFSDVLRFYLLNKYGGIYLDCDTFPVKPFDDNLLSQQFFTCKTFIGENKIVNDYSMHDIFFIGSMPRCVFDFYKGYNDQLQSNKFNLINMDFQFEYINREIKEYKKIVNNDISYLSDLCQRYYNGEKLIPSIHRIYIRHYFSNKEINYYIDHYNKKSWISNAN